MRPIVELEYDNKTAEDAVAALRTLTERMGSLISLEAIIFEPGKTHLAFSGSDKYVTSGEGDVQIYGNALAHLRRTPLGDPSRYRSNEFFNQIFSDMGYKVKKGTDGYNSLE